MRIAICDDEKTVCEEIKQYLNEFFIARNMMFVCDLFTTGEQVCSQNAAYDLIFMDYLLPDGNGIDFVKQIRRENERVFIIFSTAYPEHVFESFSLNTFRFLVKPIEKAAVFEAMDAFVSAYQTNRKIIINTLNKEIIVDADMVMYIEADKKYTLVRTVDKSYTSFKSISRYEAEINNPQYFRTHRSFIVNMKYIAEIEKKKLRLTNGEIVIVSPGVYDAFLQNYMSFLKYKF